MRHLLAKIRGSLFRLKCRLWNKKIHIGKGLHLYKKLVIRGSGSVIIGDNCLVAGTMGDSSQYTTIYTLNPEAIITIGNRASLYAGRISCRFSIKIGDDFLIEESGIADTDFHTIERSRDLPLSENIERCKIVMGNRVSIGARSIVTKGLTIGDDTVIGPGSIVNRSLPAGVFAIGNPARVVSLAKKKGINNENC